jgi:hypothetical protein
VWKLAVETYGFADKKVLRLIQEHNPHIKHMDSLTLGEKLLLPTLNDTAKR